MLCLWRSTVRLFPQIDCIANHRTPESPPRTSARSQHWLQAAIDNDEPKSTESDRYGCWPKTVISSFSNLNRHHRIYLPILQRLVISVDRRFGLVVVNFQFHVVPNSCTHRQMNRCIEWITRKERATIARVGSFLSQRKRQLLQQLLSHFCCYNKAVKYHTVIEKMSSVTTSWPGKSCLIHSNTEELNLFR